MNRTIARNLIKYIGKDVTVRSDGDDVGEPQANRTIYCAVAPRASKSPEQTAPFKAQYTQGLFDIIEDGPLMYRPLGNSLQGFFVGDNYTLTVDCVERVIPIHQGESARIILKPASWCGVRKLA